MQKMKKGFTLIELLVVIAIIAVLATVVIVNVAGARAKSVDSKTKENLAGAQKIMLQCSNSGGVPNVPGPAAVAAATNHGATVAPGGAICAGALDAGETPISATFPVMSTTKGVNGLWVYSAAGATQFSTLDGSFQFVGQAPTGAAPVQTFTCDQNGCR